MLTPGPDRTAVFPCRPGLLASLNYYRGGDDHPPHAHDHTQVSFVLGGEVQERHGQREFELSPGACGVKPAGQAHADRWGRSGALMFSIRIRDAALESELARHVGWRARLEPVGPLVRACLEASPDEREEAAWDLLGLVGRPFDRPAPPPPWLLSVREEIRDTGGQLSTEALSRRVGVSRIHLSRMFHRCFGLPPSVYRRRIVAARAICGLVDTAQSMAAISHEAGFSDQAHMTRVVRAETGLTPARLRQALGGRRPAIS